MADDERRMLFDIRGRRKNVIRVVYAVLALLMGTSLFLVVGPFNLGELVGGTGAGTATESLHDQSERIEERLARKPNDETLLLALTRTRISAGNSQIEVSEGAVEPEPVPRAARRDFELALQAWNRYLRQAGDEPNPAVAQLVSGTFFRLAESSTGVRDAEQNVTRAAAAQRIAAAERPNVNSLSTLAIYEYFAGNFGAGDRAANRAVGMVPNRQEAKGIEDQMDEYRKNAKDFERRKKQLAKVEEETGGGQQNPFELPGAGTPAG